MATVAVVGGGYAGLRAVNRLSRTLSRSHRLLLIDRGDYHQLITRLPEVAAGMVHPTRATIPFRRLLDERIERIQADVRGIYPDAMTIQIGSDLVQVDRAIIGTGSAAAFLGVPGAAQYSYTLKSVPDAIRIDERMSELRSLSRESNIVVVGAGYTGTELAGFLVQHTRLHSTSGTGFRPSVTVVAPETRLLPQGNVRLGSGAAVALERLGVKLRLGQTVTEVRPESIALESGEVLPADLIVWAARSEVPPNKWADNWPRAADGRMEVDPMLHAKGHDRVYLVGDIAATFDYARGGYFPASAQVATLSGDLAAMNVTASLAGKSEREFRPWLLGEALSLGPDDAIAEIGGLVVHGARAAGIKSAALARYLNSLGCRHLIREYV